MLCYHDKTFCAFYKTCVHGLKGDCSRPLTPEVEEAAKKVQLPIAQFTERPNCHTLNGM
jgi:hypothetical protein